MQTWLDHFCTSNYLFGKMKRYNLNSKLQILNNKKFQTVFKNVNEEES